MSDETRIIEQQKETYTNGQWDRFWVGGVRRDDDVHRRPQWKQRTVGDVIDQMNRDLGDRAESEYEIKE